MTAGLAYFINATQNRPATGQAEHKLLCALLPLTVDSSHPDIVSGRDGNPWARRNPNDDDDEEEDAVLQPISTTGMLHMRRIRLEPIPRMTTRDDDEVLAPRIPPFLYKKVFGFTHNEISVKFGPAHYHAPGMKRAYKRRGHLPLAVTHTMDPTKKITPEFTEAQMARFLAGRRMSPLSENEEEEEGGVGDEDSITLPEIWDTIWYSFLSQILGALHNPRKGTLATYHNYIYHDQDEALDDLPARPPPPNDAEIDMGKYFLSDELGGPNGFARIQTRPASLDDWNRMSMYLFPAKDQFDPTNLSGSQPLEFSQNSPYSKKLTYHALWLTLMKNSSVHDAQSIRSSVMDQFNNLRWVPWVNRTTIWDTKKDEAFEARWYPSDFRYQPGESAPRICLNPRHAYLLTWDGLPLKAGTLHRRR
jgi:hypothetical protein